MVIRGWRGGPPSLGSATCSGDKVTPERRTAARARADATGMTTLAYDTGASVLQRSRFDTAALRALYAFAGAIWLMLLPLEITLAIA
jgi:hypothetical protein